MGLGAWLRIGLPAGLGVAIAVACGGTVDMDKQKVGKDGGGGTGGMVVTGGTSGTGGTVHTGGTGGKKDSGLGGTGGSGGTGGFVDPGCPDASPPPPFEECDVFGPNTCGDGNACYPFVSYPSGPCDFEQYGSVCAPVGTGKQGDQCGAINCAANFVCVLTGQGTECVEVCDLFGAAKCPSGLFCVPIDVEGFGGCF